ncbi:ubiquitin 3 binding protein But2 C-terminal domain-containing protein [Paraphoma chrysanthemicola]|uniref:Ubiquitin 3 binding protein But2 C-terminal domain-containing protein n=1 Tax=Paraphoma chrysanthemicola TaxID=798071 RepID=A0A8K0R2E0_9PLEO|nr:ubiquitin 3 binding protein But2 C-terminal domain-containing protein [Paraphoma chrysanthemicola]
MKSFTILSILTASTLAAPSIPALSTRTFYNQKPGTCPTNSALPTGKLPAGSVSTSLLLPISAKNPDKSYPATTWATITPNDLCTIFNLDLDSNAVQGKICNLVLSLPALTQSPGSVVFSGSGKFTFTGYDINVGGVAGETTYNKQPRPGPSPPNPPAIVKPGNSYIVNAAPCGIPPNIGKVKVSGSLCSADSMLAFKQGEGLGGCPVGFYVVLTDDPNADEGEHY